MLFHSVLRLVGLFFLSSIAVSTYGCDLDYEPSPGHPELLTAAGDIDCAVIYTNKAQLHFKDFSMSNSDYHGGVRSCNGITPAVYLIDDHVGLIGEFCYDIRITSISPSVTAKGASKLIFSFDKSERDNFEFRTLMDSSNTISKAPGLVEFHYGTGASKFATSTSYPGSFPNELNILYTVETTGNNFVLCMKDLDLPLSTDCANNYVRIFSESGASSSFDLRLCGSADSNMRVIQQTASGTTATLTTPTLSENGCYFQYPTSVRKFSIQFKATESSAGFHRGFYATWN